MKALAALPFLALGMSVLPVQARTEVDILRARCAEQERQIRALETEIDRLHGLVALERRRSRGAAETAPVQTVSATPSKSAPAKYTVQAGDTLSSIARRYHTSAATLMTLNGIEDPTRLRVGQNLSLPAPKAATPAGKPAPRVAETKPAPKPAPKPQNAGKHTVAKGDTFFSVARRYDLSFNKLQALNPAVNPDRIVIGQTLAVAGTPPKAPAPALSSTTRTISTSAPAAQKPAPKKANPPVASLPKPTPQQPEPKPQPTPAPKTVSSIIVMDEISFNDFAGKHGTTTEQLNALNGLTLKGSTVLAKGSELYVPTR